MSYAPGAYYALNHGSHFARCLASAWFAGTEEQRFALEQAFAPLFSHYNALALTKTEAA